MHEDRDESTVVDLAVTNYQPRRQQRQQQQQQQQQPESSSSLAASVYPFSNISPPTSAGAGVSNAAGSNASPRKKNRYFKPPEKKDCPRHAEGHPPNKYTTRDLGNKRIVSLFYGSDVVLFDSILAYRLGNPDRRVEDAIDTFEEHQGADAMANIIYETQAFDMIFKYPIPEHLRTKISDEPPVIGLAPGISDIEISSTSSAAMARREAKAEQLRLAEEKTKKQREQAILLSSLEAGGDRKDLEALAKDPKVEKEEKLQRYRHRFKKAMLKEGLVIEEDPSIDGDEMFLKIYTPFWRLCIEAQRLRYKVELTHIETNKDKAEADKAAVKAASQGFLNRYIWRFIQRADNVSLPLRPESLLFKASKLRHYARAEKSRKWSDIVRHGGGIRPDGSGVGSNMGSDGKDGFFSTGRRGNLTESIIIYSKFRTKKGDRHALKSVMDKKAFSAMFTLHDGSYKSKVLPVPNRRTLLFQQWVRSRHSQPLEEIRMYYGEKIALYFAWIGHYTQWLVSAAIVGFAFLIFGLLNYYVFAGDGLSKSNTVAAQMGDIFDNALTLPFSLFMSVWSSLFVEFWKRKSSVLAYEWNTLDFEQRERARPEFKPTGTRISPVTGKTELYYPRYKQILSLMTSILVVFVSIGIVIVSVGSLMLFGVILRRGSPGNYKTTAITAVLNLVVIMALGTVYARLAKFLTDNENHRRLTQYQDALIIKRFLFDFVNFYSALVYIGYLKDNVGSTAKIYKTQTYHDQCVESCMNELTIQLAIVFVGKQFLNQAQELAIPQLQKWWNRKNELAEKAKFVGKYKDKKPNMVKPPQWAKDDILPDYNPQMFEEYRELVIQFGFCTLFVVAFPIAPIFALLNNALEIRVDAYKLLTQHRRPIAQAAQDIGSWEYILTLLTHLSVFTNACLIAFRSTWMKNNVFTAVQWYTPTPEGSNETNFTLLAVQLLFIFIYEHVVLLIKVLIAYLVHDVPQTVKLAIERENYYTRLALNDEEPAMDEVLEDLDDDTDDSDDEDEVRKQRYLNMDDTYTNYEHDPSDEKDLSAETTEEQEDAEDEAELEALIKAGGCGCAAHGDGLLGTAKGGFETTWMNRFRPESQAVLRRRQQRQRKRQQAQEKGQA
ncbi:hypothetical protein EMPS_04388 [Entomortierella parvispora]|uniref:Anoctamin dimerisation domain-containing protein n=1 Tax=Entomortierella parvispora TaxID=205924 RepID=A0A9P3H8J9_9FUNG|nr:hypothetical protein EMPS_04388 [Entomortierella parvispora]